MRSQYKTLTRVILFSMGALMMSASASAQKARIRDYTKSLEKTIASELQAYGAAEIEAASPDPATVPTTDWRAKNRVTERTDGARADAMRASNKTFKSVVNVSDSQDGDGQDAEIRLTMPIDDFMAFAPIAALEAAAIPHKFPVVNIYLREESTDRVGRVAFADAESIAARYRAGDIAAVEDMNDALIWH